MRYLLCFLLVLGFAGSTCAAVPPMQIYVTPYYDSNGPTVNVGKFSAALARADRGSIDGVVRAMQAEWPILPVTAMYVAAIRLYDLGHQDDAVRWFYAAQYRAKLLQALTGNAVGMGSAAAELNSAHVAFQRLAGPDINGYAGCSREKWIAAIEAAEGETIPDFKRIYASLHLPPPSAWAQSNAIVRNGLEKFRRYLQDHWSTLQRQREQNDMDAKYCAAAEAERES